MASKCSFASAWLGFCFLLISFSASAALTHRYSFNGLPGTTTVTDSVAGANGVLLRGGDFSGDGKVTLPGGSPQGAYIDLPNGLISGNISLTMEFWVTWNGGGVWQRIFDFGNNSSGLEGGEGDGVTYLILTPSSNLNRMVLGQWPL